ncbi:MAG: Lrp/AsnC ligand binding domain-containing protein [Bianqueaceae bacterium]
MHYLAGSFDCMVKIITENTTSLEKIFNQIKSLPGVSKTQTNVVLSTIKNQYSFLPSLDSSL